MAYTNIDDSSVHFQTATYTGNNSHPRTITNDGNSNLQPDWIWVKQRTTSTNHFLYDSSRTFNANGELASNEVGAEGSFDNNLYGYISAATSDGFTVSSGTTNGDDFNQSSREYVAWQWKCNGGTTASNTDGSKTATVQANQDAGFSIVTYAGSGSASTVGHGLANTPDVIIFKNRSASNVWAVYHQSLGNNYKIELNGNNAKDSDGSFMNGTLPTNSVFTVGASVNTNGSGSNYVAYAFVQKQGFSKFSSYTGNGQTLDGPFVYTGFAPAWVMIKNADNVNGRNWYIYDSKRRTYNPNGTVIRADSNGTEITDQAIDITSNGFKVKPSAIGSYGTSNINNDGQEMIFMAFAENPFVTSTGIPTTAR
jgi:hypothetical protein